jgi:hypothetical protein
MKGSVDVPSMTPAELFAYLEVCGWALALAHARSGDPAVTNGYLGTSDTFDNAITHFANAYADQNEKDFEALVKARKERRIFADMGFERLLQSNCVPPEPRWQCWPAGLSG